VKHSICIIDDFIIEVARENKFDEKLPMNSLWLNKMLENKSHWATEIPLYNLLKKLLDEKIDNKKVWDVTAFTNPNLYLKSIDNELFRSEVIVLDWDFAGGEDTEIALLEIVNKSHSLVYIYSGAGMENEIMQVINGKDFKYFKNRLNYYNKDNDLKDKTNSPTKVIQDLKKSYKENFSFKFGNELRINTLNSLEEILIELGKISINDVIWLLGEEEIASQSRELSTNDLVAIIVEKLRNDLITKKFGSNLPKIDKNKAPKPSEEIVKKLLAYRLYFKPEDSWVRKGDIIEKKGEKDVLYLVISSDCHLKRFWKKNMGTLPLVRLFKIDKSNKELKRKLEYFNAFSKIKSAIKITSITNMNGIDGPVILPLIETKSGEYIDYMLFPKEVISLDVKIPQNKEQNKRNIALMYDYLTDFNFKGRISVSEPFLTPLIQHILNNISGYGAPDYPSELQNIIQNNFKNMLEK
jgi:hypothetical protein